MTIPAFRRVTLLAVALVAASASTAQTAPAPKIDFPAASPRGLVKQRVGLTDIEINYSRPSTRGRAIFGQLEPWGEVWRAGADSATKVTFSTAVKLNGASVPAGTYGLFALLGKDEWTIILNNVSDQWGAYAYNAKDDVVRIPAKPQKLTELVESFTIDINDLRTNSATLNLVWEKTRVPVKIEVDVVTALVPQIEAVMASDAAKKPYFQAAMFYFDNNLDLNKAIAWMDAGIAAQPDAFYMIYRKAKIQAKMGDKAGALATAQTSLAMSEKQTGAIRDEYVRLNQDLIASLK